VCQSKKHDNDHASMTVLADSIASHRFILQLL
jgi:hypothetical protein